MVQGILNNTQFQWIRDPQAVVINGMAANACNASALPAGEECSTECGAYQQKVKPNTKYRVRVINAGVLSYFSMALEGHKMTLFEADVSVCAVLLMRSLLMCIDRAHTSSRSRLSRSRSVWARDTLS